LAQGRGSKPLWVSIAAANPGRPSRRGVDRNGQFDMRRVGHVVAPRAGAWIETTRSIWARSGGQVAPRAGAWIETGSCCRDGRGRGVAPRAGAWIETAASARDVREATSPLAQGRGSKLPLLRLPGRS